MNTELPAEKREKLLNVLEALLAKTTERGATEAEALAAAEKAQEIMDKYGLSLKDIQAATSEDTGHQDLPTTGRKTHEVMYVCNQIANLTSTKTWINKTVRYGKNQRVHVDVNIRFFGLHADVDVAVFLYRTFKMALDYEWAKEWRNNKHERIYADTSIQIARKSFMRGMAMRINERIAEIIEARSSANVSDSRAIVVAKEAVVEKAWSQAYDPSKFRKGSSRASKFNWDAYDQGQKAGDRVDLGSHLGHGHNRLEK